MQGLGAAEVPGKEGANVGAFAIVLVGHGENDDGDAGHGSVGLMDRNRVVVVASFPCVS